MEDYQASCCLRRFAPEINLRIIQLVPNLEIGGLERLAVDLAIEQRATGHVSSIFCLFGRGELATEAEASGVAVEVFGKMQGFSPKVLWNMRNALLRLRPEVVHTHNAVVHHYGAVAARMAGVPVVINTRHGVGAVTPNGRTERVFRSVVRQTDAIVMVSEHSRAFFTSHCSIPLTKTCVIPNGIPLWRFTPFIAKPGYRYPSITFGIAARMAAVKDHATLIRAFATVSVELPQAELHILGDGPCRRGLEQLSSELGLSHRIRFLGASTDTASFLATLDVFVLSSLSEGMPLVILEAMAVGLPIVSTRVGGIPEIAPEGAVALYCPPESPAELASQMVRISHLDLAAMGRRANQIARAHFAISTMAVEYETLYAQALNTKRQRAKLRF